MQEQEIDCPLCKLAKGNIITKLYWNSELTICVDCLTCGTGHPIIVIKRHSPAMTEQEDTEAFVKAQQYFGDNYSDMRTTAKQIKDHAHYHVLLKEVS